MCWWAEGRAVYTTEGVMAPKGRKRKITNIEETKNEENNVDLLGIPSNSSVLMTSDDSALTTNSATISNVDTPSATNISCDDIPPRRSSQRRKNLAEGRTFDPPKEKSMTLGKYLHQEREKTTQMIEETHDDINKYEVFVNYDKIEVINDLNLVEEDGFAHQLYHTPDRQVAVLFIPLSVGSHPRTFSHICNNSSMQWNLEKMHIPTSTHFGLPNVVLVFVHGQHLEGMSLTSPKSLYKCLGLVGVQSTSSGALRTGQRYEYIRATLVFDYVINRKELIEQFGDNVMKCKKNKYGTSLCE